MVTLILMVAEKDKNFIAKLKLFTVGMIFGAGLMLAGMSKRTKVQGFLELNSHWDPSLLFVLGVGVTINFITFNAIIHLR